MYTPPKAQAVTNPAQGSFWSPIESGHFTQSTILPSGGLLQNYPPGTQSGQVDQSVGQLTIVQLPKVPCSFGTCLVCIAVTSKAYWNMFSMLYPKA